MRIDATTIRLWYSVMKGDRDLTEIRILTDCAVTYSGIFENSESIVTALESFEPDPGIKVKGCYFTLNKLADHCRSKRQYGHIVKIGRGEGISDADISQRDWLLVDMDPVRPSGTSATDEEKESAHDVMRRVYKICFSDTDKPDFPAPQIIGDSGNGYHLLWRLNGIENTTEAERAVSGFLDGLTRFDTPEVKIDTSVSNASRICKLYGTMANKGEDTPERPHRMSSFYTSRPGYDHNEVVTLDDLRAISRHFTQEKENTSTSSPKPVKTAEMGDKSQLLHDVEKCLEELEAKGVRFPADRDRWLTITAGWYHSLGTEGLPLYLRFSALWENNAPREDERKYLEMAKYPREQGGATIASFFAICREQGVARPTATNGWRTALFDVTKEIALPDPLVSCGGGMIVSRGNICVITGKPKTLKTTLQSYMVASCMVGGKVLTFEAPGPLRIIVADTEQAPYHLKRQCDRAFRLAGLDRYDELTVLNLRPFAPIDRYTYIVEAIEEVRPDIVFIDGASDLITDTNDIQQSETLVSNLLTITSRYGCGIVTIVHTNPGSVEKIRGHIGSTLERKCESSILLTREGMGDTIKVSPKEARNRPFEPFTLILDEHGDLTPGMAEAPRSATDWLVTLMEPGKHYKHGELVTMLTDMKFETSNAKYAITSATTQGRIIKHKEGYIVKTMENEQG